MSQLPIPTQLEREHSQQLTLKIQAAIKQTNQNWISFASFMQMALYEPALGYYVAGMRKFGPEGDFVTAPEISSLYSQCLAKQCQQILEQFDQQLVNNDAQKPTKTILEFGAGSGVMAADILLFLASQNSLPDQYCIFEISPDLITRQQATIAQKAPELLSRVVWLAELPKNFTGVVLANEVLDAMPVHLFTVEPDRLIELGVSIDLATHALTIAPMPDEQAAQASLSVLQQRQPYLTHYDLPSGYCSEVCLAIKPWLADLYQCLDSAVVLFIDYGFHAREYYHPQRDRGTLRCHYRHHAHSDVLRYIGLQDITAHVDFTSLADNAQSVGFELAGFTTQADFLLASGLLELAQANHATQTTQQQFAQAKAIKQLILPSEMGELFKVMALTKDFVMDQKSELIGFSGSDHRGRL